MYRFRGSPVSFTPAETPLARRGQIEAFDPPIAASLGPLCLHQRPLFAPGIYQGDRVKAEKEWGKASRKPKSDSMAKLTRLGFT